MFFGSQDSPFSTTQETAQSEVNYALTHSLGTTFVSYNSFSNKLDTQYYFKRKK